MLGEAHNFILTSPTGSLFLDDGYLGDINNDVSSLSVEKSRRIDRTTNARFGFPGIPRNFQKTVNSVCKGYLHN